MISGTLRGGSGKVAMVIRRCQCFASGYLSKPQRPLAALILKWLGNGHGTRFILELTPLLFTCRYDRTGELQDSKRFDNIQSLPDIVTEFRLHCPAQEDPLPWQLP